MIVTENCEQLLDISFSRKDDTENSFYALQYSLSLCRSVNTDEKDTFIIMTCRKKQKFRCLSFDISLDM